MRGLTIVCARSLILGLAAIAPSQNPPKAPNYLKDVRAAMNVYCAGCHTGPKSEDGIDLSIYKTEAEAKKHKPICMKVKKELVEKKMPPKGEALGADDVATLKAWVDQGAK